VKFGKAIHSTAIISPSVSIAEGVMILHGSIIQADTIIGKHVLNTAASIDHECHWRLCSCVSLMLHYAEEFCGRRNTYWCGCCGFTQFKIGKWCTVGAGAVVICDIPDFTTAVGNPARILVKTVKV
jgi:acetyltransferase EpsM